MNDVQKRGRPTRAGVAADCFVQGRVTAAEKALFLAAADTRHITLGEALREALNVWAANIEPDGSNDGDGAPFDGIPPVDNPRGAAVAAAEELFPGDVVMGADGLCGRVVSVDNVRVHVHWQGWVTRTYDRSHVCFRKLTATRGRAIH